MTEKEQLELIEQDWSNIANMKNPTERVQLKAVEEDGNAFFFINEPTEKTQLAFVKRNGELIRYIENPSPRVQKQAIHSASDSIRFIKNPTKETRLLSLSKDPTNIMFFKEPTNQEILKAVSTHINSLDYIIDIPEEIEIPLAKEHFFCLKHMKKPKKETELVAFCTMTKFKAEKDPGEFRWFPRGSLFHSFMIGNKDIFIDRLPAYKKTLENELYFSDFIQFVAANHSSWLVESFEILGPLTKVQQEVWKKVRLQTIV